MKAAAQFLGAREEERGGRGAESLAGCRARTPLEHVGRRGARGGVLAQATWTWGCGRGWGGGTLLIIREIPDTCLSIMWFRQRELCFFIAGRCVWGRVGVWACGRVGEGVAVAWRWPLWRRRAAGRWCGRLSRVRYGTGR